MTEDLNQHDHLIRYLLGIASDTERRAVEERFFASDADLNVLLQAENELIDDYVRGALSASDRQLFESNFLCTAARRQRLEAIESFVEALAQAEHADTYFESKELRHSLPMEGRTTADSYDNSSQGATSHAQLALNHAHEWFANLLRWLDPDVERAAEKYETIRRRLIKLFAVRGSDNPEELADETIDRVASRAGQLIEIFVGDPAIYFNAVARKVWMEGHGRNRHDYMMAAIGRTGSATNQTYSCLEKCLEHLSESNRELILQYYGVEKESKIATRNKLAQSLGVSSNALRVRAARVRRAVENCVTSCLQENN